MNWQASECVTGFEGSIYWQQVHQSDGCDVGMFKNIQLGCCQPEVKTN